MCFSLERAEDKSRPTERKSLERNIQSDNFYISRCHFHSSLTVRPSGGSYVSNIAPNTMRLRFCGWVISPSASRVISVQSVTTCAWPKTAGAGSLSIATGRRPLRLSSSVTCGAAPSSLRPLALQLRSRAGAAVDASSFPECDGRGRCRQRWAGYAPEPGSQLRNRTPP